MSDPVADVLRAAYYYRLVDGRAVIDPALVLVAAARNDKALALPLLGASVAQALPLLAADASDGSRVDGGMLPALREARWLVLRGNEEKARAVTVPALPMWGTEVAEALERAAAAPIGVAALLLGLLRSTHPSVRTLAEATGLDIAATESAIRDQQPWAPEEPYTPLVNLITMAGLTDQRYPLLIRWIPGVIRRFTTRRERWGPVLYGLEIEILRQTVITGHPSVQAAHLPLAIVSMQQQLAATGSGVAARYREHNQGDLFLTRRGFDLRAAQQAAESLPHDADVLTPPDAQPRFPSSGKFGDPSWTHPAATAMAHAGVIARDRQHRDIGTTHLLAAALTDADSTASLLLGSLGIDAAALREELGVPGRRGRDSG